MRRAVLVLVLLAAGCGGPTDDPVPEGVRFVLEQTRTDLSGRNLQAQVVNEGPDPITVETVRLTSSRFDGTASYEGPAVVPAGATTNLTMEMPEARCGAKVDAELVVEYRIGDATTQRTSRVRPEDRYGSVKRFMDRDCAASAVDVTLGGTFATRGTGRDSVLDVPLEIAARRPVTIGAVGSTVLLRVVDGGDLGTALRPDDGPLRTTLSVRPARCDVHVVAEDRAGTLLPLEVSVGERAAPLLLRMTEEQKAQVFDFIAAHCGFGEVDDPLND